MVCRETAMDVRFLETLNPHAIWSQQNNIMMGQDGTTHKRPGRI